MLIIAIYSLNNKTVIISKPNCSNTPKITITALLIAKSI